MDSAVLFWVYARIHTRCTGDRRDAGERAWAGRLEPDNQDRSGNMEAMMLITEHFESDNGGLVRRMKDRAFELFISHMPSVGALAVLAVMIISAMIVAGNLQ